MPLVFAFQRPWMSGGSKGFEEASMRWLLGLLILYLRLIGSFFVMMSLGFSHRADKSAGSEPLHGGFLAWLPIWFLRLLLRKSLGGFVEWP